MYGVKSLGRFGELAENWLVVTRSFDLMTLCILGGRTGKRPNEKGAEQERGRNDW